MPTAAAVAHRCERVARGVRRDQDDGSLLAIALALTAQGVDTVSCTQANASKSYDIKVKGKPEGIDSHTF